MAQGGHFCHHGNLRYSCAKCREERRAARPPVQRKTYGEQRLGPGGKIPAKPWRLERALEPHEQDAVRAAADAKDGVVVMPAPLGLRRVAFTLLRSLRHDVDAIVFLVPGPRAVQAWSDALHETLHVPTEDIEDQGRNVRDWQRLRPILIWTPEHALRHASGLRQHANRLALFVDSPDATAFDHVTNILRLPFARRLGVAAARLGPTPQEAWPRLDALGGVIHRLDVQRAIQDGLLRRATHDTTLIDDDTPRAMAQGVAARVARLGRDERAVVWVDDPGTGRAVEEACAAAGIETRFVAGAATPELAQRAAKAVREGGARVLVRTTDAPATPIGTTHLVVHAAHDLSAGAAVGHAIAALVGDAGPVAFADILPRDAARLDDDTRRGLAERALTFAQAFSGHVPPLEWLRHALPVPPLPAELETRVQEAARDGWHAVQGLLPDVVNAGLDEAVALAALADTFAAARTGQSVRPLGPAPKPTTATPDGTADTTLAGPFPARTSLVSLALTFPEAANALGAILRHDLDAALKAYADAPLLHHLVPDPRVLFVSTLETIRTARLPDPNPDEPRTSAEHMLRRGGPLPAVARTAYKTASDALNADKHLERLHAAIEAERAHEIAESVDEIARLSGTERQRQGRTLIGLDLDSKRRTEVGLELRYVVPHQPGTPYTPLPYTDLNPGALVDLSTGNAYDPILRGTVANIDAYGIKILVEEDRERRAPGNGTRIDQVGNPRVFDALARAVGTVYGSGDHTLLAGPDALRAHLLCKAATHIDERGSDTTFNERLNESQRAAVALALAAPRLALVHGPPGTGKTTTLVETIRQEVARGHRVLVTADSNAAVDTVFDAYQESGGVGIRTGPLPSLTRRHLVGLHVDTLRARAPGIDWLTRIPVVFTTHVSSAALPRELGFDVVIQDEASQATEPASCLSVRRAPKLVLAGDHLQLPPVVRADDARDLGLAVSLFERMHHAYGESLGRLLTVQYRMHPDIESWSNAAFYDGRIETAVDPPPVASAVSAGLLPASPRAVFVDIAGHEESRRTSKERIAEADWIATRVRSMLDAGVRPAQIAVIAAYRAQVRLLRERLADTDVDVGTIDAFQGSERDIVFVSLVRGNPRGEVGFVRDPRRLNVAMTRARRHLVVVGNADTLREAPILRSLIERLGQMSP